MWTPWHSTRQFQCRLYILVTDILLYIGSNFNNNGHGKDDGYGLIIIFGPKQHLIPDEPTLLLISTETARTKESLQKKRTLRKTAREGTRAA